MFHVHFINKEPHHNKYVDDRLSHIFDLSCVACSCRAMNNAQCTPNLFISECDGVHSHFIRNNNTLIDRIGNLTKFLAPRWIRLCSLSVMGIHIAVAIVLAIFSSMEFSFSQLLMPIVTACLICIDAAWSILASFKSAEMHRDLYFIVRVCISGSASSSLIGFAWSLGNIVLDWNLANLIVVYSIICLFTGFAYAYCIFIYWSYFRHTRLPVKNA